MAKVLVEGPGMSLSASTANTVAELKEEFEFEGYRAVVNGKTVSDDYELADKDFVTFAKKTDGAI